MNKKKVSIVLIIAMFALIATVAVAVGAPSGGSATSTYYALQNMGSATANVVVDYRNMNGSLKYTKSGITIPMGAGVFFDQRLDSSLGTSFQGGAVASSDQQLASAVIVFKKPTSTGALTATEAYGGYDSSQTGQSFIAPQIVKGITSLGLVFDSKITVQNTDPSASANITITFTPSPGQSGTAATVYGTASANGVYELDQATQVGIGTVFFGAAKIDSNRNVAVVVLTTAKGSTKDQLLMGYSALSGGSTAPLVMPFVYKKINSLNSTYSTAFLVTNFGNTTATVVITYSPAGVGTVVGADTKLIGPGASLNVDQRFDAPSITSATFLGSAVVKSTNGQPLAVLGNLRGAPNVGSPNTANGMTYNSMSAGGLDVYAPLAYKFLAADGYKWSTAVVVHNFGATPAHVTMSFYDTRAGHAAVLNQGPYPVTDTVQFDLRFNTAFLGSDFQGSVWVHSTDNPINVLVQARGSGNPNPKGDAFWAYLATYK